MYVFVGVATGEQIYQGRAWKIPCHDDVVKGSPPGRV